MQILELKSVNGLLKLSYTMHSDGAVEVDYAFDVVKNAPDMLRLGMQMQIPSDFDELTWYGLGPQETYWDRHIGAMTGVCTQSVRNDFFHYVVPQESNNHWDTRWARLGYWV